MTTFKKILGDTGIYFFANLLNAGIPFLLLPVLTRSLGAGDYGFVSAFGIALAVSFAIIGLSVHGAVSVKYFQMSKADLANFVTCALLVVISVSCLLILIAFSLLQVLEVKFFFSFEWVFLIISAALFQVLGFIKLSLLQASGNAKSYGIFQVSQSSFNAVASLLLVIVFLKGGEGRALGQAVALFVFGFLALISLWRNGYVVFPKRVRKNSIDVIKFGVPLIPHIVGSMLIGMGGQALINKNLGVNSAGLYLVAFQFGAASGLFADAFNRVYSPWLYRKLSVGGVSVNRHIVGVSYIIFLFFILSGFVLSLIVYCIFPYVVGEKFLLARSLAGWLFFSNSFVGMYYVVAGLYFFSAKTHLIAISTIGGGGCALVFMWFLGERFGLNGYVAGYFIGQLMTFLIAWVTSANVIYLPWLDFKCVLDVIRKKL